jgi:hypothetical protein
MKLGLDSRAELAAFLRPSAAPWRSPGWVDEKHESSGQRLPTYVENEFRRYLECGLHAHGFARAVCETCGDELLLPFRANRLPARCAVARAGRSARRQDRQDPDQQGARARSRSELPVRCLPARDPRRRCAERPRNHRAAGAERAAAHRGHAQAGLGQHHAAGGRSGAGRHRSRRRQGGKLRHPARHRARRQPHAGAGAHFRRLGCVHGCAHAAGHRNTARRDNVAGSRPARMCHEAVLSRDEHGSAWRQRQRRSWFSGARVRHEQLRAPSCVRKCWNQAATSTGAGGWYETCLVRWMRFAPSDLLLPFVSCALACSDSGPPPENVAGFVCALSQYKFDGECFQRCSTPADCGKGRICSANKGCMPFCQSDDDCATGPCNLYNGWCNSVANEREGAIGEPCGGACRGTCRGDSVAGFARPCSLSARVAATTLSAGVTVGQ